MPEDNKNENPNDNLDDNTKWQKLQIQLRWQHCVNNSRLQPNQYPYQVTTTPDDDLGDNPDDDSWQIRWQHQVTPLSNSISK
jgi:hypothetical protein